MQVSGAVAGGMCIGVFSVYVGYIQLSFVRPSGCDLSGLGYVVPYVARYVLWY